VITVRYIDCAGVKVGKQAYVMCLDHPRLENRVWLRTSVVRLIQPSPIGPLFTTRNTLYVPHEPVLHTHSIVRDLSKLILEQAKEVSRAPVES